MMYLSGRRVHGILPVRLGIETLGAKGAEGRTAAADGHRLLAQAFQLVDDGTSRLDLAQIQGFLVTLARPLVLAGPALVRRRGRYHFQTAAAVRLQHEKTRQRAIQQAVRQLVRLHRQGARKVERRGQDRLDFIQPVTA